ncbi:MAG TPA: MFS transporter [Bryobacteraceae bacterium]|nr:MFS transporter [Bryobacteraceae bacterium]
MRWWILFLLFLATLINYMDRTIFAVLIPVMRSDLHIDETVYGYLTAAFLAAYTIGYLVMGRVVDALGTKSGFSVAAGAWSVAAALHATAASAFQLGGFRGLLGFAEAGNFPAAIKGVAEWFPQEQRALATGLFNSGSNLAQVVGPPVFVALNHAFGWRTCFLLTGSLGFVWLLLWWASYRTPPTVELEEKLVKLSYLEAVKFKQTWGFASAKFLTDSAWWFYLFWLPLCLHDARHMTDKEYARALSFIYFVACFGSMGGGWLSGFLMERGWAKGKARKTAMLVCAAAMPIAALGVVVPNALLAVGLFSIATSAHQGFSANLFTTTSDVFPKSALGSVNGIGGCMGGLGGVIFSAIVPGYLVKFIGYTPLFLVMSTFYLIALFILHKLMGDLKPIAEPGVRS